MMKQHKEFVLSANGFLINANMNQIPGGQEHE